MSEKVVKWSIGNWATMTAVFLSWATENLKEAKGELATMCQGIINYVDYGSDESATDEDRERYYKNNISKVGKHLDSWPNPADKWAKVAQEIIKVKNVFIAMRTKFHTKVFNLTVKDPTTGKMAKICHIFDVRSTKGKNKQIYHHDLESYLKTKLDSDEKNLLKRLETGDWDGTRKDLFKVRERASNES